MDVSGRAHLARLCKGVAIDVGPFPADPAINQPGNLRVTIYRREPIKLFLKIAPAAPNEVPESSQAGGELAYSLSAASPLNRAQSARTSVTEVGASGCLAPCSTAVILALRMARAHHGAKGGQLRLRTEAGSHKPQRAAWQRCESMEVVRRG